MLASGAHVKIGTYEYNIAEEIENHYSHAFQRPYVQGRVEGDEGKLTSSPRLFWTWEDFSGGEGNRIYYPDQPTVYNYAEGLSPRIRGQLAPRPSRSRTTVSVQNVGVKPIFAAAQGKLWVTAGVNATPLFRFYYTSDGSSWTEVAADSATNQGIVAVTGDADYLYVVERNTTDATIRTLARFTTAGFVDEVGISYSPDDAPIQIALASYNGYIYGWSGVLLERLATIDLAGQVQTVSPVLGKAPVYADYNSTVWADMTPAENSLVMFYTKDGLSKLYEFNDDRGFSEIWAAPIGFSIKSIIYQNGVVYCLGHWGADASASIQGFGAMYAIDLDTRKGSFVKWFRRESIGDLQMQEGCVSYGSQILVASAKTGRIFVYDADLNAVSMLDDLDTSRFGAGTNKTDALSFTSGTQRIGSMATFGNKRFAVVYNPSSSASGSYDIMSYSNDEPSNRQGATATGSYAMSWYSAEHDFQEPFEGKTLLGVDVTWEVEDNATTSGLVSGQQLKIYATLDGQTEFQVGSTITSSTTPSSGIKGRTFLSLLNPGSDKTFYKMTLRAAIESVTSGVKAPIVKSLTAEAVPNNYVESWDLIIRVRDEQVGERPSGRMWKAPTLRDYIEDIAQARQSVTFLDGYRYQDTGHYTTHTVTVDGPVDVIERNSEGYMRIHLEAQRT